jgi:hypothetical protein
VTLEAKTTHFASLHLPRACHHQLQHLRPHRSQKMEWPKTNASTGKPSTTPTVQSIVLAAAAAAQAALPDQVADFCRRVQNSTRHWRTEYMEIFEDFVRLQAAASPEVVVAMCEAGLRHAEESFVYRVDDDTATTLAGAFRTMDTLHPLRSITYSGKMPAKGGPTPFEIASPHGTDAKPIWVKGEEAIAQIDAWKNYDCMEPSAAEHASAVCGRVDASDLVTGKTFCLLGVTSEMGPTHSLLKIPGSQVMGVARAGSKTDDLVAWFAREGAPGSTLEIPDGGADLLEQVPQIARWIVDTSPKDNELVLMPLAYMDGEACVRVTVAMDKIVTHVVENRKNVRLVYLISPATAYAIPKEAVEHSRKRYEKDRLSFSRFVSLASFGRLAKPTFVWTEDNTVNGMSILNGMVHLQGPNYALSKMMQQWRCMAANAAGVPVVAPQAPATRTDSVVHSPQAAAALEGLNFFPPLLVFDVAPISSLLTAIVLHQLSEASSTNGGKLLNHPLELFWDGSVHGGTWRCPYNTDSCGAVAWIMGSTVAKKGSSPVASLAPRPSEFVK